MADGMERAAALWVGIAISYLTPFSHTGSRPERCHFYGLVQDTNDSKANSLHMKHARTTSNLFTEITFLVACRV